VFSTEVSETSEAQTNQSHTSEAQNDHLSNSELSSQETWIAAPETHPSNEPSHPNRMAQTVLIAVVSVMGLTVISGVVYSILAKANVQPRSQPSIVEPTPSGWHQGNQTSPKREAPLQTQDSHEDSAKMLLNRARRLAAISRFEDAIAEANKVPFDSLLYPETRQAIDQWSAQALQQEAEQKAIQQSNQQHWHLAQLALDQDNWQTALQEVNQINVNATNQNSFWQQQREDMVQKIEPYQHEYKAREFLEKGELENAVYEVNQLLPIAPWREKRNIIIEQVKQKLTDNEVAQKWDARCRALTQGNISRCPNLEELKEFVDLLPSTRWLPGLNSPGRKSKR
jgi:hypothetical protein